MCGGLACLWFYNCHLSKLNRHKRFSRWFIYIVKNHFHLFFLFLFDTSLEKSHFGTPGVGFRVKVGGAQRGNGGRDGRRTVHGLPEGNVQE